LEENKKLAKPFDITEYKKKNILRCSPDWNELNDWLEETSIPPIPGAGIYKWKISTKNDSAQFYFNQGINMYYSFHIIEAMASFKKAAKFDPSCGMLYWAQALAYGPNINDYGYRASAEALEATKKATENAGYSPIEKRLIHAMSVRYSVDSSQTRAKLNEDYVQAMKKLYEEYRTHPDIQALYADAMMLQHPWDLWTADGKPKEWTPRIREVLEKLLVKNPMHPGANHYYIHVMEPSPFAAKALPSAERLGKTNPGLSHVVHMPSHIYLRTGLYKKGVEVNVNAVNSYKRSIPLYAPVTGADFLYIIHNLHMKTNNAMMTGNYDASRRAADETKNSIPGDYLSIPAPMGNVMQYIHAAPLFVQIRFGKWDEILQEAAPAATHVYSSVLYHFAKSIAYAKKKNREAASVELDAMLEFMKDSSLALPMTPFSAPSVGADVAHMLLLGIIHEEKDQLDGAIRYYKKADSIEVNMVYNEPRDWLLSPKHFLGNAYLKNSQWKAAENVFLQDLDYNNENGWSLLGLYQSYIKARKTAEASKAMMRHKTAFAKADIEISSAVY
jgi:tetratricopeptide (TPR) repeat protein